MSDHHDDRHSHRPLVLIHGFLGSPDDWQPLRAALEVESRRNRPHCIVVDLCEIARTVARGLQNERRCGLSELAREISRQLAEDPRTNAGFDVIGYSMGGRIALELLAQRRGEIDPGRGPMRCILVSADPGIEETSLRESRVACDEDRARQLVAIADADAATRTRMAAAFIDGWYSTAMFAMLRATENYQSFADRRTVDLARGDSALVWASMVSDASPGRSISRWDLLCDNADMCTLVVGEADAKYLAIADRAHRRGIRTLRVRCADHAVAIEQPTALAFEVLRVRECSTTGTP
ncbi:MAG: alpha/beta fold hydrolase [Phycisphaerales bacterium]|nr:alpha/beta fold hydrolase [Phycisphaerales bacterium]